MAKGRMRGTEVAAGSAWTCHAHRRCVPHRLEVTVPTRENGGVGEVPPPVPPLQRDDAPASDIRSVSTIPMPVTPPAATRRISRDDIIAIAKQGRIWEFVPLALRM